MELKLNRDKCAQRNRLAARRDGVNAARMKFLSTAPAPETCARAKGSMPRSLNEAMKKINESPYVKEPLSSQDVFIHYAEAANDNFLNDRYMWMGQNTLKNIAIAAERGIAFMNSHATGGMSAPAELPYGRTFAGRYEEVIQADGSVRRRALIGVYMLRGVHPNGAFGPSTDDLHAAIQGGTLFDVSVGLYGGEAICDVCAGDLETCGHIPGSTHDMGDEQIEAQVQRGVPNGRASYTYENGLCHEVSAVYDGAVPGAGFSKALRFVKAMNEEELAEVRDAFASLLGETFELKAKETAMADDKPMPEEDDEEKPEGEASPVEEKEADEPAAADVAPEDDEADPNEGDAAPVEEEPEGEMPVEEEDEDEEDDEEAPDAVIAAIHRANEENAAFRARLAELETERIVSKYTKRLNPMQLKALAPIANAVVRGDKVERAALEAFLDASPDLEAVFGKATKSQPDPIPELPITKQINVSAVAMANTIAARLEARGVKRFTPEWNREYALETTAYNREQSASR